MSESSAMRPPGTVLVTGGTGTLGRALVAGLRARGESPRVLSRTHGAGLTTADLGTGAGLDAALDGVDTVFHLATSNRDDLDISRALLDAARAQARPPHLVYVSIVGVEQIPLPYYRGKLAVERAIEGSGLPFAILRATQFHPFIERLFSAQRALPVLLAPDFSAQPIAVDEVAGRLIGLADAGTLGRAADIGGPEVLSLHQLALAYRAARGGRRPVARVALPGATARAYRAGHNLVPGPPFGRQRFGEYLASRFGIHGA
ncbi:SDR family oxidoreductase [Microterricola pindariensis]|nr:NmrA family NAD(P)-binding protein [Microterricola pindariensis]